jgi:flagellar biosynthesis/type III secretory pathway ATPase
VLDEAIRLRTGMDGFLQQAIHERAGVDDSLAQLETLFH